MYCLEGRDDFSCIAGMVAMVKVELYFHLVSINPQFPVRLFDKCV